MKNIEVISKNKGYTAINIGDLDKLTEHSLIHPKTKQEIIKNDQHMWSLNI